MPAPIGTSLSTVTRTLDADAAWLQNLDAAGHIVEPVALSGNSDGTERRAEAG